MNRTNEYVQLSDYLLSRNINLKLYTRLQEKLEEVAKEVAKECPELSITISMSAKYQKPFIQVESGTEDGYVEVDGVQVDIFGKIEHATTNILDDIGFEYVELEEKDSAYFIHFED